VANHKAKTGTRPGLGNLIPPKPGEVRNPKGHNQYTYRRTFEGQIEALLKSKNQCGESNSELIANKAIELAKNGDKIAFGEVLKRLWPATEKHEVTGKDGEPLTNPDPIPLDNLSADERSTVLRLAAKALQGGSE